MIRQPRNWPRCRLNTTVDLRCCPGKYMIKFLARDNETGRIGTFQTTFVIPNLNKVEKRVPMSAVVLSSQRVDIKDAI